MRNWYYLFIILFLGCSSAIAQQYDGYTLYSTQNSSAAYLMDTNQTTYHSWTGLSAQTGYSIHMEPGGTIVRAAKGGTNPSGVPGGPICGKIQKHDYNGNLVWDFVYAGTDYITHHDICPMPNGNVLVIAYERKTAAEVSAAGGQNSIQMWPDKIVEIQPTGLTTGTVVWEWHTWDHLCQSVDASKANYVSSIVDNPQLMNINYKQASDWQHMNGIDYNPILDQIAFSSHNHNEWYIIDHSTTTAEAASHSGGNSGKGGDILYRWGNPAAYGATGTQILNVTHDAHWIREGCPNAGRLAGFNNKGVSNNQSAADQIVTPISGYNYTLTTGQAYLPSTYSDRHACNGYSSNMGSTYQLPNGNQLICIATSGKIYEINSAGTQLWTKTFSGSIAQSQKYSKCYIDNPAPAIPTITLSGSTLSSSSATSYQWYLNGQQIAGATSQTYTPTSSGIYLVRITDNNGCVYQYSKGFKYTQSAAGLNEIDLSDAITAYPNPTDGYINLKNTQVFGKEFAVQVSDQSGKVIFSQMNSTFIDLSTMSNGVYYLSVQSGQYKANKTIILRK
ncbi:MAG: aryl-sulfate sulfotransferase [Chitinophagaceae bacterium]|nr:aryl-sulfate sulfotransferase [Chitinophagaceae bacterium]